MQKQYALALLLLSTSLIWSMEQMEQEIPPARPLAECKATILQNVAQTQHTERTFATAAITSGPELAQLAQEKLTEKEITQSGQNATTMEEFMGLLLGQLTDKKQLPLTTHYTLTEKDFNEINHFFETTAHSHQELIRKIARHREQEIQNGQGGISEAKPFLISTNERAILKNALPKGLSYLVTGRYDLSYKNQRGRRKQNNKATKQPDYTHIRELD